LTGLYPTSADAQKPIDKFKGLILKGITDVRMNNLNCILLFYLFSNIFLIVHLHPQVEAQALKMREIVRKNFDPSLVEKFDNVEKEFKKNAADIKLFLDDKITKPINDKYDLKKMSELILKTTKDLEVSL